MGFTEYIDSLNRAFCNGASQVFLSSSVYLLVCILQQYLFKNCKSASSMQNLSSNSVFIGVALFFNHLHFGCSIEYFSKLERNEAITTNTNSNQLKYVLIQERKKERKGAIWRIIRKEIIKKRYE